VDGGTARQGSSPVALGLLRPLQQRAGRAADRNVHMWRMALAKDLLRKNDLSLAEVAARVGYGSASTFSTAFSRHVGQPPARYARSSH
jgi:transcriptional regulator GlxA family with amidase domain